MTVQGASGGGGGATPGLGFLTDFLLGDRGNVGTFGDRFGRWKSDDDLLDAENPEVAMWNVHNAQVHEMDLHHRTYGIDPSTGLTMHEADEAGSTGGGGDPTLMAQLNGGMTAAHRTGNTSGT